MCLTLEFQIVTLTFAAAAGIRATGRVTSTAFKEVNVVRFNEGLTTIPGPVCMRLGGINQKLARKF